MTLCCDESQAKTMDAGLSQSDGIVSRCPTCEKNFAQTVCEMTCAPDHSRFLTAGTVKTNPVDNVKYIDDIEYRLDDEYAQSIYNSCKGIIHPASGRPIMDIMCGAQDSRTCDHRKWLGYLGDKENNEYVPFQITYNFDESSEENRLKGDPKKCNENYEGLYSCSCIDCADSCPAGKPPAGETFGFTVAELNGYTFITAILFGIIVIPLVIFNWIGFLKCCTATPHFCGGFGFVGDGLYKIFKWWGTFCAKNPWFILMLCSWLIIGLGSGIKYMKVTTDPVELWAAEVSSTRTEKEYFDSHFAPFYRNNQLFIKPKLSLENVSLLTKIIFILSSKKSCR